MRQGVHHVVVLRHTTPFFCLSEANFSLFFTSLFSFLCIFVAVTLRFAHVYVHYAHARQRPKNALIRLKQHIRELPCSVNKGLVTCRDTTREFVCFISMEKTNITISAGGMYQKWGCIMDLVEENTAKTLEQLANTKGWREVQVCEAKDMGFGELAEWSVPETDELVLIDDNFLVCLNKGDIKMS